MPEQTLPGGRLVYGHPSKLIQKTDTKRQPVTKADGTPVMIRQFGVAYPKDVFGKYIWPIMEAAARGAYGGQNPPPHFAYKFKDGDSVDRQGRPYSQREGYAGCYVVHFETQFDLNAFRFNPQSGGWDQITENDYKTGDYIQVNASIEGNKPSDPTHTPGLFINPKGVLHVGNGTPIVNAPSADQMFGGQPAFALPPGATAPGSAPPMPAGMPNPPGFGGSMPPGGMPAAPAANPTPLSPGVPPAAPVYQQPPAYPAAPPAAALVPGAPAYPPATGFIAEAAGQPPQAAPPAYPVPGAPPAAPVYQQPPAAAPVPGAPAYPTMPPGGVPGR